MKIKRANGFQRVLNFHIRSNLIPEWPDLFRSVSPNQIRNRSALLTAGVEQFGSIRTRQDCVVKENKDTNAP